MEPELGQIFGIGFGTKARSFIFQGLRIRSDFWNWIWELKLSPLYFKNQNQNQFKN
jgi:hypothetical protein